jgi:hypothetical protein
VPVAVACRRLRLSTQGYYKWLKEPGSQGDWDDAHAIDALLDIHADDPQSAPGSSPRSWAMSARTHQRTGSGASVSFRPRT